MPRWRRFPPNGEAQTSEGRYLLLHGSKDCKSEDEEYQIRVKARGEELVALSETLKILTDDESRELFGKTISLVQLSAVHQSVSSAQLAAMQDRALERAMHRIAMVAKKNKNWMLATLAVRVRLDAFSKVKEVMDKMLVELDKQQKEEIAKMEQCKTDFDTTEDSIKVAENTKDDLGEKHLGLSNLIETLTKEIADAQKEESEMEISLKQAGEARKAQSKEFQTSVMDQRATINILSKAQARLTAYYNTKAGAFLQQPQKPSFNSYEKSGGAGGVLQLLQKVITEAEIAEKEIVTSNQKARKRSSRLHIRLRLFDCMRFAAACACLQCLRAGSIHEPLLLAMKCTDSIEKRHAGGFLEDTEVVKRATLPGTGAVRLRGVRAGHQ